MPRFDDWYAFAPYVSAAEKRARAAAHLERLTRLAGKRGKKGRTPQPVVLSGRKIAATFWGKAWCDNLESYADFAYRLQRGRSYLRAGAVVDLHVAPRQISAHVSGSALYAVELTIGALRAPRWKSIAAACAGKIGSLVGLLRGELPDEVMRTVTDRASGLFPEPRHIQMSCTCPDAERANVCKHVAAALYGVGARLDARPELLFVLRGVDAQDLVQQVADALPTGEATPAGVDGDLGALFGIELAETDPEPVSRGPSRPSGSGPRRGRPAAPRRSPTR
jgi:uncharacterized Zn finger protein